MPLLQVDYFFTNVYQHIQSSGQTLFFHSLNSHSNYEVGITIPISQTGKLRTSHVINSITLGKITLRLLFEVFFLCTVLYF